MRRNLHQDKFLWLVVTFCCVLIVIFAMIIKLNRLTNKISNYDIRFDKSITLITQAPLNNHEFVTDTTSGNYDSWSLAIDNNIKKECRELGNIDDQERCITSAKNNESFYGKEEAQKKISGISQQVIKALKNQDYPTLAKYIHPDYGVRLSPYAHVDETNMNFSANEIVKLSKDANIYFWDYYDGSGLPMEISYKDYYLRYIYDVDFANASRINYNVTIGRGNTTGNNFNIYARSISVEYFLPESGYGSNDWKALGLIYQEKKGKWYLVGIIHDEWTI